MKPDSNSLVDAVTEVIRQRKTLKVLADVEQPIEIPEEVAECNQPRVIAALKTAGWAPFHYDRNVEGIVEPLRGHLLWHCECRQVAKHFDDWCSDIKPGNKLPRMLSACGALALLTWVPQFRCETDGDVSVSKEKQVAIDDEHLAAAAAMIQNFLLLLTAHGMGTYWSSGGQLGSQEVFRKLGIGNRENLLGAIFIEYPELRENDLERIPGKHRDKRSDAWIREVTIK